MAFFLSASPIDPAACGSALPDARAGACVTFEGRVRNRSAGRTVTLLEYEASAPLALKEGEAVLAEARERFGLLAAVCIHRTGRLAPGELAVWVAVTAPHRAAAFDGCRYVIDQTKARVPVWKKEHYEDGPSAWIEGSGPGPG